MTEDNNELEMIRELEKDLKPKLYWPIWNTIICSGPPLNLLFRYFLEEDIKNPTAVTILTVIGTIWTILNWYWYVKEKKEFKNNWEKISIELQHLNYQEKPSKHIADKIFDVLIVTAIVSIVMFFVFAAITIINNLSILRYLMIFSLLIFFLAIAGIIIVSTVMLFSLFRELIKEVGLKKVLKGFILIYALTAIVLIIINFIIHKQLVWIQSLIYSLIITIPILFIYEAVVLYKELKKICLLNTSNDEDDRN